MFYYYGRKEQIAGLYPTPQYDLIIEPFAGSAGYSLLHWRKQVILIDKYDAIVKVWKYLQTLSAEDALNLPILCDGDCLDWINNEDGTMDGMRLLLGFYAGLSARQPRTTVSSWAAQRFERKQTPWHILAKNIHKIKHWQIFEGDYTSAPDVEATWFIDPPYKKQGHEYAHSNKSINYQELAEWCRSRKGQVIVCEQDDADWLPFEHLKTISHSIAKRTRREVIWTNSNQPDQLKLWSA